MITFFFLDTWMIEFFTSKITKNTHVRESNFDQSDFAHYNTWWIYTYKQH